MSQDGHIAAEWSEEKKEENTDSESFFADTHLQYLIINVSSVCKNSFLGVLVR